LTCSSAPLLEPTNECLKVKTHNTIDLLILKSIYISIAVFVSLHQLFDNHPEGIWIQNLQAKKTIV
jgi:hypothetical protein